MPGLRLKNYWPWIGLRSSGNSLYTTSEAGLELSLEEARQLGHNYIGTEHLLLGLIREGEGVAARVLENLGVDLRKSGRK
jgi:ATP-dependent Clp protease ATP-binding subunit ClpA